MGYCSLDEIKRLLRVLENIGDNQYKIRLSESHSIPKSFETNTGSGNLSDITVDSTSYAGSEYWWVKFTSPTAFTLYRGEGEYTSDGSGTTGADFTSTSGIIKIESAKWSGTPAIGDKFHFKTNSNISDDDAEYFIGDGDAIIDGTLQEYIDEDEVPFLGVIPNLITKSSIYYSSSLIFTSVYSMLNPDEIPTLIRRWYNLGRQFAEMYLQSIPAKAIKKYREHARFVARAPLFTKVGITEASGVEGMAGEIDAQNVEYDRDYNTKETLGTS